MFRAWAGLYLVVLLAIGCRDRGAPPDETSATRPSSTDETALVDDAFRFRLAWPGDGWKVLRERDARSLGGDSVVGGLLHPKLTAFVSVEPLPDLDLNALTQRAIDDVELTNKHSSIEVRTVGEESRFVLTGAGHGHDQTVHGRVLVHQGYHYVITAIQIDTEPSVELAERALAAFSFTDGPVVGRADTTPARDLDAPGWRLRGDRFEHGPARLRLTVPRGWRVMEERDLAQLGDSPVLGLRSRVDEVYVVVRSERVVGVDRDAYLANLRTPNDGWAVQGAPVDLVVGNVPVAVSRLHRKRATLMERLSGAVIVGQRSYEFAIVYPARNAERARPQLTALLSALEFLDDRAAATLDSELSDLADRRVSIGADVALRGGVYYDFANRLRWRQPAGAWRITLGGDASDATLRLAAHRVNDDTYVTLHAEAWDRDLAAYEAAIRAALPTRRVRNGATTIGGRPARYLEWTIDGTAPMRYRTTLAIHDGRAVKLTVRAMAGSWPADTMLAAIVDGVTLLHAMPMTDVGPPYRDHRFGFEVNLPAGWIMEEPSVMPISTSVTWDREPGVVMVAATQVLVADDEQALRTVEEVMMNRFGSLIDGAPKREPIWLDGLRGTRLLWLDGSTRAELQLVRRDEVIYAVLAMSTEGGSAISAGRTALSLLD